MRLINCKSNPPKNKKIFFDMYQSNFVSLSTTLLYPTRGENSISVQSYFVHCLKKSLNMMLTTRAQFVRTFTPNFLYLCSLLLPLCTMDFLSQDENFLSLVWKNFLSLECENFPSLRWKVFRPYDGKLYKSR